MSKTFEGKVVSLKMQKTAVVEVTRRKTHPLYKKVLTRSKRYKVDIGNFSLNTGDLVKIAEVRPISKFKHFKVERVLKKSGVGKLLEQMEKLESVEEIKQDKKTRKISKIEKNTVKTQKQRRVE